MPVLRRMLAAMASAPDQCVTPKRNSLTTDCFGSCYTGGSATALCVNYARRPSDPALVEGDGNYYYAGCAYAEMPECLTGVGANDCSLQCLETTNSANKQWVLDVSKSQADRLSTSLFQNIEKLDLPDSLTRVRIVGTTELTRKVPIYFAPDAFTSGKNLKTFEMVDLGVNNVSYNIFPDNLETVIMQRTQLTEFNPVGNNMSSLKKLDLSENELTSIPDFVFDAENLKELDLTGNDLSNLELTPEQIAKLQDLDKFDGDIHADEDECPEDFTLYTWDDKSVCYDTNGSANGSGGKLPDGDLVPLNDTDPSSGSDVGIIIAGIAAFVVLAIVAGVFFLKRSKRRAQSGDDDNGMSHSATAAAAATSTGKTGTNKKKKKKSLGGFVGTLLTRHHSGGLEDPLHTPARKSTYREIPAADVQILDTVAQTSVITVMAAQYHKDKVYVNRLRVSEDAAENCETALNVSPVMSQLRHPQLLTVIGFMWEDVHTMSAVCEFMSKGPLEDYLISAAATLTWANFKLRAALDVAGCLMYLHGQNNKLTYDGLSGKTVFVDAKKGCKLSTLMAALPSGLMKAHLVKSTRAFCAPEVLAGEASTGASDMYSFGVLLAQLDSCEPANDMIRNAVRVQSGVGLGSGSAIESEMLLAAAGKQAEELGASSTSTATTSRNSSSLMSMFTFTSECPNTVKELAQSCLQYDPTMRPNAQYVSAMLQHLV